MILPLKDEGKIVFLGFGGPLSLLEIVPFLEMLFSDRNIIQFPFQLQLAAQVRMHHECIGVHSPAAFNLNSTFNWVAV